LVSASPQVGLTDSQIYYFEVGKGIWRGSFDFKITDRDGFKRARLGLKDRLLMRGMTVMTPGRIDSELWAHPDEGAAGVAGNTVRISKFGLTLYLLKETYTLDPNGKDVAVHAHERFGPIPFLLRNEKRHPAEIYTDGMSSAYFMPLVGADWVARYTVRGDRRHIDGHLTCAFAEAREVIDKQSS
jgi:hypothetical protein